MTPERVFATVAVGLFCLGLHALLARRQLLHRVLALNTMSTAVFLLLVTVAYRDRAPEPDPVPHALVLTGIVVAVSATALLLALARRVHGDTGRTDLPEEPSPPSDAADGDTPGPSG